MNKNVKQTVQRAADWRLASLLLSRPCDRWREEIQCLARENLNKELQHAAKEALITASEEDYLAVAGPAGHISPREIAYIGVEDPGLVMADLVHFYESFHYDPQTEDPNDHISVQSGFAGYLALKEAYALSTGNREASRITRLASKHFLANHLSRLIRGMASKISGSEPEYIQTALRYLVRRARHVPTTHVQTASQLSEETISCCF